MFTPFIFVNFHNKHNKLAVHESHDSLSYIHPIPLVFTFIIIIHQITGSTNNLFFN